MKIKIHGSFRNLPMFWQTLLTLLLLVSLLLTIHAVSNRLYEKKLTEQYLTQVESDLHRNCASTFLTMRMISAIPTALDGTRGYDYIRAESSGHLPEKYYPALRMLQKNLNNQVYLNGDSIECAIYLPGANSMCTRYRVFPVAEDCFNEYLRFEKTTPETVLSLLKGRNVIKILPVEEISCNKATFNGLCLIIHQVNSNIGVLTIYPEDIILDMLGYYDLPEGSGLHIENFQGEVLLDRSSGELNKAGYEVSCSDSFFRCETTLFLPENFFSDQLKKTRHASLSITVAAALLGILISILISRFQVKPIKQLATVFGPDSANGKIENEVSYLHQIYSNNKDEIDSLSDALLKVLLIRVFSGNVLTAQDEESLSQQIGEATLGYRLAVFGFKGNNPPQLNTLENFYTVPIDRSSFGLLFRDTGSNLELLQQIVDSSSNGTSFYVGVSAPLTDFNNIHIAVRQAYLSFPDNEGMEIYTGDVSKLGSMTWLQHERLYRAILINDELNTNQILQTIAKSHNLYSDAKETFYCIRYIIYNAANELGVPFTEKERVYYDSMCSGEQNILALRELSDTIFYKIAQKKKHSHDLVQEQIRLYIDENCSDYNMCAASVGEQLGISEKSVYSSIRKMTDMSFGEYLLTVRMKKSEVLLRETSKSIEEIAELSGYQVLSTFYRAFNKYYGCTPTHFRASITPIEDKTDL